MGPRVGNEPGVQLRDDDQMTDFAAFVAGVEPRLRRALVSAYGPERGRDATAEALAWAFEHQDRLSELRNPVPYLYRVGQSRSRTRLEGRPFERSCYDEPWVEPDLAAALSALPGPQREAVLLVHAGGWAPADVAELLGIPVATVQKRVERAIVRLRRKLKV
jgi:DNA-directed RNA polymerase specialized sigma24 family protein